MAKDANGNDIPEPKKPDTGNDTPDKGPVPYERFAEVVKDKNTMKERLDALEKTLAEQQAKQKQAEDAQLAEQGRYKELADKAQAEVARLAEVEKQHKAYRERVAGRNKARVEAIPENYRELVPNYTDPFELEEWLTRNEAKLAGKPPAGSPPAGPKPGPGGAPLDDIRAIDEELKTLQGQYGENARVRRILLLEQKQSLQGGQHPKGNPQKP